MPIVKRINKYQGLRDIDVLVEEQGTTSRYFNVTGMPSEIPQGKSSFLVGGSPFLKSNIELKIEMIDSKGRTVYMEPVSNYLESESRRVSIEVYPDTSPGIGQLYIVGELKNNYQSISEGQNAFDEITDVVIPTPSTSDVPLKFQGVYNVRFVMPVLINTTISNTEPILFYKQPRLTVNEIVKGFVHEIAPSSSYDVSGSLSINRLQGSQIEPPAPTPEDGQPTGLTESDRNDVGRSLAIFKNRRSRKRDPFRNSLFGKRGRIMRRSSPEVDKSTGIINSVSKTPENAVDNISSTFVGETLNIKNITIDSSPLEGQSFTVTSSYSTQIKKVINNTTFIPLEDFTVTLQSGEKVPVDITNASFTASVSPTPGFAISTTEFRSFADITIGNLRTFSGDVYKAIVYGKSKGSLGDFEPMYEAFIESPEVLVDKLSPTGFSSTAYFFTQSIVDSYWTTVNGTAVESDDVLIDGVTISGSNYAKDGNVIFKTQHLYDLEPNVSYNVEFNTYYYKANKQQEDSSVTSDAIMEVYVTGSKAGNKELLGKVNVGDGNEGRIDSIFKSFISAPKTPKLALEFHVKAGRFILQDLSVRPTSETNFNPDYHRVIVPMPHPMPVKPDQYDFVVEFFDVNNNQAETFANTENVEFTGAPIMISGPGNFLSGSMMLGTGMELYGGSAFLRTTGYRGFEHTLTNNQGGFMVFSGSIGGPSAPKNLITSSEDYDGVGLEIIDAHDANNPRYLKFRTNPSTFEVITDSFYFGKQRNQANAQFVSGSSGNIEISSSKLHLKPDGDIIVNKVTAQEGTIGDFQIIDNMISGSNISFNATRSQIFKTDQGPGSDNSAAFEQLRDEYYIDFTPSESVDKVNNYRPGYYIKMGPNFMVDKDGILIASGAEFVGTITASAGLIGGFSTDDSSFSSTNIFISGSPLVGGVDDDKYKFINTTNFNVKQNGDITGSQVLFTGGKIGGFSVDATKLSGGTDSDFIGLVPGTGIQLGDSTFSDAPFSVTNAGVLKAESGTVGGWNLGAEALTGGDMIIRRDGTIESAGFASDVAGSGFRLTAASGGFLEVENAKIRGTLSTAVFEKESVNAVGGQLYVANSTVLTGSSENPGGFHSATQQTMSVVNASGFVAGEILTIKKIHNTGFNTEYLLVESSSRFNPSSEIDLGGNLFVQRGYGQGGTGDSGSLGGAAGSATNYTGSQVVVSTGRVGTGYIRLNANPSDQATPYIDIVERTGSGLYDIDLVARLGDLSGLSSARLHGTNPSGQFGLYSKNVFLEGGITANTGSIAGIKMQNEKLFVGPGTHGGATTGYFVSASGDFSLKDKLVFDATANTLTLKGALRQTSAGTTIPDFLDRGNWTTNGAGTAYEVNDLVQYNDGSTTSTYKCVGAHTSTNDNNTSTGRPDVNTNWAVYAAGSTGAAGAAAKGLTVSLDSQTFTFDDSSDTSSTPTSILFSINQQNLGGTVTTSDITITDSGGSTISNPTLGTDVTSGTGTVSGSLEFASNLSGDKTKLPVTVSVTKDSITDSATIFKIEGGADGAEGTAGTDGSDGLDAYTVILTNESHTVGQSSSQSGGTFDLSGTGTEIIVFRGVTQLTGSLTTPTTGTYSASFVGDNFTPGVASISDNKVIFADMTVNPTDTSGSVTFTINAEGSSSFTKIQSLNVNQSADSGSDGAPGASGSDGAAGAQGPGVTFTGAWEAGRIYNGAGSIKDIVKYDAGSGDVFYSARTNHTSSDDTNVDTGRPDQATNAWEQFGAQFTSVATDILLAQDSTITRGLVIGNTDGTGSFIRSVDKTALGLENGSGFFLSSSGHFSFQKTGSNSSHIQMDSGGIEISSSKFHLKNDGDVIVRKVEADDGDIGGFSITGTTISSTTGITGSLRLTKAVTQTTTAIDVGPTVVSTLNEGRVRIKYNGQLTGSRVKFDGGTIGGFSLKNGNLKSGNFVISGSGGGKLKTAESGRRVEIDASTNSLKFFGGATNPGTVEFSDSLTSYVLAPGFSEGLGSYSLYSYAGIDLNKASLIITPDTTQAFMGVGIKMPHRETNDHGDFVGYGITYGGPASLSIFSEGTTMGGSYTLLQQGTGDVYGQHYRLGHSGGTGQITGIRMDFSDAPEVQNADGGTSLTGFKMTTSPGVDVTGYLGISGNAAQTEGESFGLYVDMHHTSSMKVGTHPYEYGTSYGIYLDTDVHFKTANIDHELNYGVYSKSPFNSFAGNVVIGSAAHGTAMANAARTLYVTGISYFQGDAHVTGDLEVAGNIDLGGNIVGDGSSTISGIATIDTGQGANELYGMDQDVKTTSGVTFATVDTGQGANELYDMDQDVKTTNTVTFSSANFTNGFTAGGGTTFESYEEGTWTPYIYGNSGGTTGYGASTSATYRKVGGIVFAEFKIYNIVDDGSSTDDFYIGNLPFTCARTGVGGNAMLRTVNLHDNTVNLNLYVTTAEKIFVYQTIDNGAYDAINYQDHVGNDDYVWGQAIYFTND